MNQIYYLVSMGHKIWISCAKELMVIYRQSSRLSRINKANMNRIIWDRRNNILNINIKFEIYCLAIRQYSNNITSYEFIAPYILFKS